MKRTLMLSKKANSAPGASTMCRAKKSLKSMVLHAKDFATEDGSFDEKFRWIDLGVVDFVPSEYF